MQAYTQMLQILRAMQLPILTVEYIVENVFADEEVETKHVVAYAHNGKTTDFVFVRMPKSTEFTLFSIYHLNMDFNQAIAHFGKITLRQPGALMRLESL